MGEEETVEQMEVPHRFQHRLARFEAHSALMVIAHLQGFSPVYHAGESPAPFGPVTACNQIEEGGFAGGVPAHNANALIALEIIGDVAQVAPLLPPEAHILAVNKFPKEFMTFQSLLAVLALISHQTLVKELLLFQSR